MDDDTLRFVVGGILLVHGIAHVGPIGAQLWIRSGHVTPAGSWSAARSWVAPGLSADTADEAAWWIRKSGVSGTRDADTMAPVAHRSRPWKTLVLA
jgi:hypothetical protein